MTIIAYKHGVMVADGWEVTGLLHKPCDVGKIRRVSDGGLIGVAGSAVDCEAALAWFQTVRDPAQYPEMRNGIGADGEIDALWAKPDGTIWRSGIGLKTWHRQSGSCAVGSAWLVAETLMLAGQSAQQAVEFCCANCVGIGGDIQVERVARV